MKTYLEPEEVQQLETAAGYLRDKLLVRLLWRLGCRVSEALRIGVEDVDFDRYTIMIEHEKMRWKWYCPDCNARLSRTAKFCPNCGNKVAAAVASASEHHRKRILPVDEETLAMLRDYIDRGGPVDVEGKRLLFDIGRRQALNIIRECAAKAGLEPLVNPETSEPRGISPHRLRDAFAVNWMKQDDSGDSQRLLQEMLGHQSFDTTAKYRKVSGTELREQYDKIWKEAG
jgi:integrase/recombinase XerD